MTDLIMTIDLMPFTDNFSEEIQELMANKDYNGFIMIKLFCVYFEKLVNDDIKFQFPFDYFTNIRSMHMRGVGYREHITNNLERLGQILWSEFISWSSFQVEFIDLSSVESIMDLDTDELLLWDNPERIKYIQEYQEQLLTDYQSDLFEKVPGPIIDCLDFPYQRAAIYLHSEKVSRYLDFAARNSDIIHNQFKREHWRIRQALHIVEQPVAEEWMKCYVKKDSRYIIGFYVGEDIENGITMKNLNWNFFVALYVLENLLELADDYFHFYGER